MNRLLLIALLMAISVWSIESGYAQGGYQLDAGLVGGGGGHSDGGSYLLQGATGQALTAGSQANGYHLQAGFLAINTAPMESETFAIYLPAVTGPD